jgi:hypothetical protein
VAGQVALSRRSQCKGWTHETALHLRSLTGTLFEHSIMRILGSVARMTDEKTAHSFDKKNRREDTIWKT